MRLYLIYYLCIEVHSQFNIWRNCWGRRWHHVFSGKGQLLSLYSLFCLQKQLFSRCCTCSLWAFLINIPADEVIKKSLKCILSVMFVPYQVFFFLIPLIMQLTRTIVLCISRIVTDTDRNLNHRKKSKIKKNFGRALLSRSRWRWESFQRNGK